MTAEFSNEGGVTGDDYKFYLKMNGNNVVTGSDDQFAPGESKTLTYVHTFDFDADTVVDPLDGSFMIMLFHAEGQTELSDETVQIEARYHCKIVNANPPGPIDHITPQTPVCGTCGLQRPCGTAGTSVVCTFPEVTQHGPVLDYGVANVPGQSGCASCGGVVGGVRNVPNSLVFERRLIPANQVTIGNSSPGMYFLDMDLRLDLYHGSSPIRNYAIFSDPNCERAVYMTDNGPTGVFTPDAPGSIYVGDLTIYDSSQTITSEIDDAVTAKIKSHDGWIYEFVIAATSMGCFHRGGTISSITSPDGFVKTFTYKSFTQEQIDESPTRQYQIDTITDPSGNVATITYHPTQMASRWAISDIDVNGGMVLLKYDYNVSGHLETVKRNGEIIATYDYGTDTEWDAAYIKWDHRLWENPQANDTIYISSDYLLWEGELVNQFADNLVGRADGSGFRYMSVSQHDTIAGLYRVEHRGQLVQWQAGVYWRYFETWSSSGPGYNGYSGTLEDSVNNIAYSHHYDVEPTNYMIAQPRHLIDNTGYSVEITYDTEGNMHIKNHGDDYEKWFYDANNQVIYYRDRAGYVTLTERDARGLVVRVTRGHIDLDGDGISTPEPEATQTIYGYYGAAHQNEGLLKWTATNAYAAGPVVEPAADVRTDLPSTTPPTS